MGLIELIKGIIATKNIDIKYLPSQGIFYPIDFKISIKKAQQNDIDEYESKYSTDDLYAIITSIKNIVRKNTILNKRYQYSNIKSVDLVYLFLEIVKHTQNKEIKFSFYNDILGTPDYVEFGNKTFNYFNYSEYEYDSITREILMDGYRMSLPAVGVEDSLTEYLLKKSNDIDISKYNEYSYDFLYFLGNKSRLTFNEIDNLITIFNYDIDDSEKEKINNIVTKFSNLIGYTVKKDGHIIEIKNKLDLANIWK